MKKIVWKQWMLAFSLIMLALISNGYKVGAEDQGKSDVCGPVNFFSFEGDVDEPQYHWSWKYATKTLTLSGVNMDGSLLSYNNKTVHDYVFKLPAGSTVVAAPGTVNVIKGRDDLELRTRGTIFDVIRKDSSKEQLTITGEGVYNISNFKYGICSEANKTVIKDTTINFEKGGVCYRQINCRNGDAVTVLDHAKIAVKECTAGFFAEGEYKAEAAVSTGDILSKNAIEVLDSDLDIECDDFYTTDVRNCFMVRNGYLKLVRSNLKLKSPDPVISVWQEAPANTTVVDDLIPMEQENVQPGVYHSSIQKEIGKNHFRADTFSPEGTQMDFTFLQSETGFDLCYGHTYTNAVTELSMTVPNITVSYNSMGGNEIAAVSGRAGAVTVETLPVPEKAGYSFLGWSETPDSGNYITTLTNVTKDMTLYANWKEKANTATNPSKTSAAKTFTKGSITYQYINKTTVKVVKIKSKKIKNITIPATVKVKGKKYKVTTIGANTFANCKNLKKVVLGKYVVKIEKKAFYKCKKLAYIQMNSKKLKSVGTKAIYGIQKKAKIVCDKKCVKKYKKLFKKKTGFKKPMSVKKKK